MCVRNASRFTILLLAREMYARNDSILLTRERSEHMNYNEARSVNSCVNE